MTPEQWVIMLGGAIIVILQSMVAFFVKGMYDEFKAVGVKVQSHSERIAIQEFRMSQLEQHPSSIRARTHAV